jgi:hypothetical protein
LIFLRGREEGHEAGRGYCSFYAPPSHALISSRCLVGVGDFVVDFCWFFVWVWALVWSFRVETVAEIGYCSFIEFVRFVVFAFCLNSIFVDKECCVFE